MRPQGKTITLSLPRRLIVDLLHFAQQIPSVPVQRSINVAVLCAARRLIPAAPSWCAVFTKAYALVADRFPELRRAYLNWPWPRLYEHHVSKASIAIERDYHGEKAVFFVHLHDPARQDLMAIDAHLNWCKDAPLNDISLFRRALRVSRLPLPLRRFLWWFGLNSSGSKRATRMGTFGVSVYSGMGAESLHPMSPLTTTLTYGVIQPDGQVTVRLIYDHRVMDGATVARALADLNEVLQTNILAELQSLPTVQVPMLLRGANIEYGRQLRAG